MDKQTGTVVTFHANSKDQAFASSAEAFLQWLRDLFKGILGHFGGIFGW